MIDKAVKEDDTIGGFYYIFPTSGLTAIYLTNEQFVVLQEHKLLEFEDVQKE